MTNVVNICSNQPFVRSEVDSEFKEVEYSNMSAVTLFLFVGVYNIWLLYAPFLYMSFLYFIKHNECTKKQYVYSFRFVLNKSHSDTNFLIFFFIFSFCFSM